MAPILEALRAFYRFPAVRQRMWEFLGNGSHATCVYITADGTEWPARTPQPPSSLAHQLDCGLDICRSLWDRESLLAHLDIEYVNFDFPAEPYLDPVRTFTLQGPVETAAARDLHRLGIPFLQVLSGRGHHFVWKIPQRGVLFETLRQLGQAAVNGDARTSCNESLEAAFSGLGLVIEHLARRIRREAQCRIPLEFTAVEVQPGGRGREMVSLDLSEYADPLASRTVRIPFSGYLKPWQQAYAMGDLERLGPIFFIPKPDLSTLECLPASRDPVLAAELAARTSCVIPDGSDGMARLVAEYLGSDLRVFHEEFHAIAHEPVWNWPVTYDRLPLEKLPTGVREALLFPNDLLLRPASIQAVTRCLLDRGWHPRHIAGVVRSKFERDYGWGPAWEGYSPARRADFYVRLFAATHAEEASSRNRNSRLATAGWSQ